MLTSVADDSEEYNVRWKLDAEPTSFTIYMRDFCGALLETCVTFTSFPDRPGFFYKFRASKAVLSAYDKGENILDHQWSNADFRQARGVHIELSDDKKDCVMTFSLEFMLEIARAQRSSITGFCMHALGAKAAHRALQVL